MLSKVAITVTRIRSYNVLVYVNVTVSIANINYRTENNRTGFE